MNLRKEDWEAGGEEGEATFLLEGLSIGLLLDCIFHSEVRDNLKNEKNEKWKINLKNESQ